MAQNRVTMRDIAKACGVSVATVSHALNHSSKESISDAQRLRIIQMATQMHYVPARIRSAEAGRSAGIIINLKEQNAPGKKLMYYDLAAELGAALRAAGYRVVQVAGSHLQQMCADEALRGLDAWFMIDVDNEHFKGCNEGFYGPIILLDGELEETLFCKVLPNYTALYERANAMLRGETAFLAIEDIKSLALLKKIVAPFAPSSVYVNRPGAKLDAFLEKQRGKKGIVLGDILGMQVQAAFNAQDVVVAASLEPDGLLRADAPCLYVRNRTKAVAAVETLQAMLNYEYESKGGNHILLDCEST